MRLRSAHAILFGIFVLAFALHVLIVILAYSKSAISGADASTLILKLLAIYSVPLTVILGGIFAKETYKSTNAELDKSSRPALYFAVIVGVLWNLLLLWRSIAFGYAVYNPAADDNVTQLDSFLDVTSAASSFLIAGALAFFFTKA